MKETITTRSEKPRATSRIISKDELKKIIYKDETTPQDKRFLDEDGGGVFKYFDLRSLIDTINKTNKFYPAVELDNEIIGIAELEESPYEENVLWIKYMSIEERHQDKKYASQLADEIFRFARDNGYILQSSSYMSDNSEKKLRSKFLELAEKYGIKFIDGQRRGKNL